MGRRNLDNNILNFEVGAVVNANIATKCLSQVYRPVQIKFLQIKNQKPKLRARERERERERDPPEGLGENEKGREAHGVGGVVEEESGAVTEI